MMTNNLTDGMKVALTDVKPASASRVAWLDMAKTIGLLLMVAGHGKFVDETSRALIYAFHMPLFFIASGMLFKPSLPVSTLKRCFHTLLWPMVLVVAIAIVWYGMIKLGAHTYSHATILLWIKSSFFGLSYSINGLEPIGGTQWFLVALAYIFLIASLGFKRPYLWLAIVSVVGPAIALLIDALGYRIYTPIQQALLSFPFFALGFYMKPLLRLSMSRGTVLTACIAGFAVLWLAFTFNGRVDINSFRYGGNLAWFYIGGIGGSIAVFALCRLLAKSGKALNSYCSTLAFGAILVLGLNLEFIWVVETINGRLNPDWGVNPPIWLSLIEIIAILTAFRYLIPLVKHYFPALIGRARNPQTGR